MKLETLAKRIALRANCPELEGYILTGDFPPLGDCILWTGYCIPTQPGTFMHRHRDGTIYPVFRRPAPIIRFQGAQHRVPRLLHKLANKLGPEDEFEMKPLCGHNLCVNPRHWQTTEPEPEPEVVVLEANYSEDWTDEDIEEVLDMVLIKNPQSWDEIINDEILEDAPPDMVRACLIKLNKEHLTK